MNRLLLTAVAALAMGASGHAMAASFTIDTFTDSEYFDAVDGANLTSAAPVGDYSRIANYVSTTPPSQAYFGDSDLPALQISNDPIANGTLTVNYNISALKAGLGAGSSALSFTILGADGNGRASIDALLNGNSIGHWTSTQSVDFNTPASYQLGAFNFANSALTGTSDHLTLVFSGDTGYDITVGPLAIADIALGGDIPPVPEPGMLPMIGSGLLVAGFAARRRRKIEG